MATYDSTYPSTGRLTLLTLPLELRQKIYRFAAATNLGVYRMPTRTGMKPMALLACTCDLPTLTALSRACQRIKSEIAPLKLSISAFTLCDTNRPGSERVSFAWERKEDLLMLVPSVPAVTLSKEVMLGNMLKQVALRAKGMIGTVEGRKKGVTVNFALL